MSPRDVLAEHRIDYSEERGQFFCAGIGCRSDWFSSSVDHAAHQLDMLKAAGYAVTRWCAVAGFPGYEISDQGDVRSTKYSARRYLATTLSHGYPSVQLRRDGKYHHYGVHQLVMLTFVGPYPDGMEIRHLDGNQLNSCLSNLAYGTSSENGDDTVRHGTHHNAGKTHCKRGHPYTGSNVRVHTKKNGRKYRVCRACKNENARKNYRAADAAAGVDR